MTLSLERTSKTRIFDADLCLLRYELDLKSWFVENKSNNPKLRQKLLAQQLSYSVSTVRR